MPFAGAFALDNLQKFAEALRQRKLLEEKTAFERGQVGVTNRRADEALNIQRQQLEGANEDRRLARERQDRLDERQLAIDAFMQGNTVAEQVQPGFIPESDPVVKRLPPHLLTPQAARGGEDFVGPLQPGQTSPTARPGGFIKSATPAQLKAKEEAERALRDDERLEETLIETGRHNRAMEARGGAAGGGNPYFIPIQTGQGIVPFNTRSGQWDDPNRRDLRPGMTAEQDLTRSQAVLGTLRNIEQEFNPAWVGPIKGRYKTMQIALVGERGEQGLAALQATTAQLANTVINLRTGAQMSEPEAQRILKEIPDFNLPPDVFMAKLGVARSYFEDWLKYRSTLAFGRTTQGDVNQMIQGQPPQRGQPSGGGRDLGADWGARAKKGPM